MSVAGCVVTVGCPNTSGSPAAGNENICNSKIERTIAGSILFISPPEKYPEYPVVCPDVCKYKKSTPLLSMNLNENPIGQKLRIKQKAPYGAF